MSMRLEDLTPEQRLMLELLLDTRTAASADTVIVKQPNGDWSRPQWAVDRAERVEELQRRGWPAGSFAHWTEGEVEREHGLNRTYEDWKVAQVLQALVDAGA